ncbi:MAG TPA: hypothetical protein VKA57_13030 [Solirubrobacteraceae bacterium]|nr:hypothetical protein [Solirubrobacteraceae bacterium]
MNDRPVVIARRFNGPPGSGHGGYSAGRAGVLVDGPAAEVTLLRPPPLETPLAVRRNAEVALLDGADVVAEARPAELSVGGPPPVSVKQAAAASERFAWEHDHPFPTCFGCGPERDPADALCLFTGPVGDGRFAVPWTPPAWTGDGVVEPVFAWAALDCPSSAPVHGTISSPVVLGRFSVALERPIEVGAPHVIQAWLERSDDRKRHTAVAIFTAAGERRAVGRAVWVQLARPLGT